MAKVMISLPDELLTAIDAEAEVRGVTRSRLLREAAAGSLGWPTPEELDAALARGRSALAGAGSFESGGVVRSGRDASDRRDRGR